MQALEEPYEGDDVPPEAEPAVNDEARLRLSPIAIATLHAHDELVQRFRRGEGGDLCTLVGSSQKVLSELEPLIPESVEALEQCPDGDCQDVAESWNRLGARVVGVQISVGAEAILRALDLAALSRVFPKRSPFALTLLALDAFTRPWPAYLEQATELQGCFDVKGPIVPLRALTKLWPNIPACLRPFAAASLAKAMKKSLDTSCFCDFTHKTLDGYERLISAFESLPGGVDAASIAKHKERLMKYRNTRTTAKLICKY